MEPLRIIKNALLFFLRWVPRIMCFLLVAFTLLFTFDKEATFWKTIIDLLTHLIPTFLVIFLLVLSWKWSWIGGITFIALGIVYIIWYVPKSQSHAIDIYLFIIGILFLLDWFLRKNIKKAN